MSFFDSLPQLGTLDRAQEIALAKRIKKGDEAAIGELVLANMREAMVYCRAVVRNVDDGQLMSICYEALVRNAKKFDPVKWNKRFLAFAKPGLRGAFYRHYNKETAVLAPLVTQEVLNAERQNAHFTPDPGDDPGEAETQVVQPDYDAVFTRDRWTTVKPVFERVCTEQEKMVLTLTYISGFNFQETSDLLSITRSAVQRTHARAMKKIRTELAKSTQLLNECPT